MVKNRCTRNTALALALLMTFAMVFGSTSVAFARAITVAQPAELAVKSTSPGEITLEWKAVDGAIGYYLYRSDNEAEGYELVGVHYDRNNLVYKDNTCEANKAYYYTISNVYIRNFKIYESDQSSPIYVTAASPADAIIFAPLADDVPAESFSGFDVLPFNEADFVASPCIKVGIIENIAAQGPGSVQITWSDITGAVKYYVCRATSLRGKYEIVGETDNTSFTDESCMPNTKYYYSLCAELADGKIAAEIPMPQPVQTSAGTVVATPGSSPAASPSPIATPTATAAPSKQPTKTPVALPESTPTAEPTPTAAPAEAPSTPPSIAATSALPSAASTAIPAIVLDGVTPTPIAEISIMAEPYAKSSYVGVELSWEKVAGAKKYSVYRSIDGENYALLSTSSSRSYNDKRTPSNANLWYKVEADNGAVTVAAVATMKQELKLKTAAVGGNTESAIRISWKAIQGAAYYDIYRSKDNINFEQVASIQAPNESYIDAALDQNTTYYYKVMSDNGTEGYISGKTKEIKLLIVAAPNGVGNNRAIQLHWKAAPGASSYTITRKSMFGETINLGTTTELSLYDKKDLRPLTVYFYTITADNGITGTRSAPALW